MDVDGLPVSLQQDGIPRLDQRGTVRQAKPRHRKLEHRAPTTEGRGVVRTRAQGRRVAKRRHRGIGRRDQVARGVRERSVEVEHDRLAHLQPSRHFCASASIRVCGETR
jgi:hypothetical protein